MSSISLEGGHIGSAFKLISLFMKRLKSASISSFGAAKARAPLPPIDDETNFMPIEARLKHQPVIGAIFIESGRLAG